MARVAINGLGRIGRASLKIVLDTAGLELVAINDQGPADNLAYLLRFDTVYGRYGKKVEAKEKAVPIDGREIPVLSEKDPSELPWGEMKIDAVFECTGLFTTEDDLMGVRFATERLPGTGRIMQ